VHLQLAKYHEACRFTDDGIYDKDAAFFHLKAAAECNIVVAQVILIKIIIVWCSTNSSDVRRNKHVYKRLTIVSMATAGYYYPD